MGALPYCCTNTDPSLNLLKSLLKSLTEGYKRYISCLFLLLTLPRQTNVIIVLVKPLKRDTINWYISTNVEISMHGYLCFIFNMLTLCLDVGFCYLYWFGLTDDICCVWIKQYLFDRQFMEFRFRSNLFWRSHFFCIARESC